MSITRPHRGRRLAAFVAGVLALGGLVAVAPTAQAAQTGAPVAGSGVATWGISDLLGTARTGIPGPVAASYDAPAAYDATSKLSTWGDGSGTVAADGSATLSFAGSSLHWTPTGNAFVKIANIDAEFDADGDGQVTADVLYGTTTGGDLSTAVVKRGPSRVTIVDLYSTDPDPATYPDSLEDLTYAFTSDADSYDWSGLTGRWAPELATFLAGDAAVDPAIPGFVYASVFQNGQASSGSTAGVLRWPAAFAFSVDRTEAATVPTASLDQDGIEIEVAGTGFLKTFPGVYLSLREVPDPATPYAGGAVSPDLATVWVSNLASDIGAGEQGAAAAIAEDGSFSTSLRISPEDVALLDAAKSYTVVTRKAHGMGTLPSHASQITETPVDLAALITEAQTPQETTTSVTGPTSVGYRTTPSYQVVVAGGSPTGSVTLTGGGATQTLPLVAGTVAFTLPAGLPAGTRTLQFSYPGNATTQASAKSLPITIRKGASTTAVTLVRAATTKVAGKFRIRVSSVRGGPAPAGKVKVVLTKGSLKRTLAARQLSNGTVLVTLPRLARKGLWTLRASYGGGPNHGVSAKVRQFRVR